MQRGEIWWASLPKPIESEPGYRRPVLIVQSDAYNRTNIRTVMAVILTSNTDLAGVPGNVRMTPRVSGLPKDSVANVTQVVTLDKQVLTKKVRTLDRHTLSQIEDGLRLTLSL